MELIKLTKTRDSTQIYINVNQIICIQPATGRDGGSMVSTTEVSQGGESWMHLVKETPDKVVDKILQATVERH